MFNILVSNLQMKLNKYHRIQRVLRLGSFYKVNCKTVHYQLHKSYNKY